MTKGNFSLGIEFITVPLWKCLLYIFGDVATGLFLKGNCGSRMDLETVAQNYEGATTLVHWQKAHSLGKMLFQGAL